CLPIGSPPRFTLFPYTTLFRSVDFYVADGTIIAGKVIDEQGNGLAASDVLFRTELRRSPIVATTDRNGEFELVAPRNSGSFFLQDRKSTRLNSSHVKISYAVFC